MTLLNLAYHFVDRHVEEGQGDRVALYTSKRAPDPSGQPTERATTYAELATLVNRVGNVLTDLGARRNDRVLLALSDGLEFVATWYAAQKIGAVTAEVYTFLQPKDYRYFLDYTAAPVVIADSVTLERLRDAGIADRQVVVVGGAGTEPLRVNEHDFATLVARASDNLAAAPTALSDVAIWKFTTGSTGAPKACAHTAASPIISYQGYALDVLGVGADDIVLPVPKLFFGYARDLAALYPFGVGGAGIAFPERSTADRIFELIARFRPTILINVPTMMSAMLAHPNAADQDLSSLRLCTSAGEALPADLHRAWDETFGVEVVEGIGSSEAYHIYISNRPGAVRRGTCGQVVPGYSARVVGPDGVEVPDGDVGTLEVTGGSAALEYYGDPEKSAETFQGDTVRTGDLFSRDAEGFYTYQGRADDLLKSGGIFVVPSEIEHCLIGHPDVVECGVVGYEVGGLTRPRAYVVLRNGVAGTPALATALQEYVRERLAGHKRPRDIRFVDALPRTSNGKLDRRTLRTYS